MSCLWRLRRKHLVSRGVTQHLQLAPNSPIGNGKLISDKVPERPEYFKKKVKNPKYVVLTARPNTEL
jgi:hypothetical protein